MPPLVCVYLSPLRKAFGNVCLGQTYTLQVKGLMEVYTQEKPITEAEQKIMKKGTAVASSGDVSILRKVKEQASRSF